MITETLERVSALGPFFEIATDPAESADPTWTPLAGMRLSSDLLNDYERRLGTTEDRVAASILFQSIAARLWSPAVAAAALYGEVPDLHDVHWRWLPGTPVALWLPRPTALPADTVVGSVMSVLAPVREAFGESVKLADGLMWGNAASALAGTLRAVPRDVASAMRPVVEEMLHKGPLADKGYFVRPGAFLRRSCCLYYRIPPGGGYCGDCPLG
jgi:hypothetical protein